MTFTRDHLEHLAERNHSIEHYLSHGKSCGNWIWRIGATTHDPYLKVRTPLCVDYPEAMDWAEHPIGTTINQGPPVIFRKNGPSKKGAIGWEIPRYVTDAIAERRGIRMGLTGVSIQLSMREGNRAQHSINDGWDWRERFEISGLTSQMPATYDQLIADAELALVAIVGNRGTTGPPMPSGNGAGIVYTMLMDFEYEALGPDFVVGHIHYRGRPATRKSYGGSLGHIESNLDIFGNPITVSYTYPTNYGLVSSPGSGKGSGDPVWAGITNTVSKLVDKPVNEPVTTVIFQIEPPCVLNGETVNADAIMSYLKAQEGDININLYDPTGATGQEYLLGAPYCYMLENVGGDSQDGGITYEAHMSFHLRPQTWLTTVTYVNTDTGEPPPDLVIGTGQVQAQMYPAVTFPTFTFPAN